MATEYETAKLALVRASMAEALTHLAEQVRKLSDQQLEQHRDVVENAIRTLQSELDDCRS